MTSFMFLIGFYNFIVRYVLLRYYIKEININISVLRFKMLSLIAETWHLGMTNYFSHSFRYLPFVSTQTSHWLGLTFKAEAERKLFFVMGGAMFFLFMDLVLLHKHIYIQSVASWRSKLLLSYIHRFLVLWFFFKFFFSNECSGTAVTE